MPRRWSRKKPQLRKFARSRGLTKKQKAGVKRIMGAVMEKKHHTSTFSTSSVSSTATLTNISAVTQGDSDTSRDGDQIYLKNIDFRAYLTRADTSNLVRLIVFQWRPSTQLATPTAATILENYAGDGTLDLVRHWNYDNKRNFKVLYDRLITLNEDIANRTVKFNLNKSLIKKIQFDNGGTNHNNAVYVMYLSDSSAATHPSIDARIETTYLDA